MAKPAYTVKGNVNLVDGVLKAVLDFAKGSKEANLPGRIEFRISSAADATKESDSDLDLSAEAKAPTTPTPYGEVSAGASTGWSRTRTGLRETDSDVLVEGWLVLGQHRDEESQSSSRAKT